MDKLDRAHLDALPVLLQPIISCAQWRSEPITGHEARKILMAWDKARTPSDEMTVVVRYEDMTPVEIMESYSGHRN